MEIFLSWSGEKSREVAELFNNWLRCVLQACKPWLSTHDIESGALWYSDISNTLGKVSTGIICLTKENKERPWILFEAGALAKGLNKNRVCTFLVDLTPEDIGQPLSQFNHTVFAKDSIQKLVYTINNRLEDRMLDTSTLDTVFETYWEHFEKQFTIIINKYTNDTNQDNDNDNEANQSEMLEEILYSVRNMNNRIKRLEKENPDKNDFYSIFNKNKIDYNQMFKTINENRNLELSNLFNTSIKEKLNLLEDDENKGA